MASASKKSEKDKNQHIQVYVRCRPANFQEKESLNVIELGQNNREVIMKERIGNKDLSKKFTFDRVFGPNSTQVDVYRAVAGPMIDEVLTGYNCTVFAYGQTGTGKTYTMEGAKSGSLYTWDTDPKSGIIPRTFHHLFDILGEQELEYNVRVSYLELYNEELFDLLGPFQEMPKLRLYEDSTKKGSVVIQGLSEIIVHNKDEVYQILERGAERKRMAFTQMNDASSRSHTVFSITVHIKESTSEGEDLVKIGKLNLVDLAGSECIGRSGAVDKRAREAGNINQSLLTLGRVITALVEKGPHIPYRESKLTRLLQDSLGGRTKTSIIATISPSALNSEETSSTLEYAHRAKNITNKPEVNQKMTKRTLIKEYTEEIERLRRDLLATREKNGIFVDEENYNAMRAKLSNQSEAINEKLAHIEALKQQIEMVNALFNDTRNELETRTQELHNTNQVLKNKERKLQQREAVLRQTEFEREEQKHLVNKQLQTEKCLSTQAMELLQVATSTTKDLSGLFSKLDRKSDVESTNNEHVKQLQRNMTEQIECLKTNILQLICGQGKLLCNLKESLDAGTSELMSRFKTQAQSLGNLVLGDTTFIQSSQNNLLQLRQDSQKDVEAMLALNAENKLDISPHIQALYSTNMEMIADIELMHNRQTQQVNDMSEALGDAFITVSTFLENTESTLNQEIEKIEQTVQNAEALMKVRTEKEDEAFQALLAAANQYYKERQESYKINDVWKENALSVASGLRDMKNKSCADLQIAVNKSTIDSTRNLESSNQDLSEQRTRLCRTVKKYENQMGVLEGHMEQYLQKQCNLLTAHNHRIDTDLAATAQQALDHQATVQVVKAENEIAISEHQDFMTGFKEGQIQSFDSIILKNTDQNDLLSYKLSKLADSLNNFVETKMRVDVPTGLTPARKEYQFPRDLASTAPHDMILQEFRKIMDPSMAVGISVPDSPFKEYENGSSDLVQPLRPPEFDCPSDASDSANGPTDIKENKGKSKVCRPKNTQKFKYQGNTKLPLRSPNK